MTTQQSEDRALARQKCTPCKGETPALGREEIRLTKNDFILAAKISELNGNDG